MKRINLLLIAVWLSSFCALAQKKVEYFWDTDPGVGRGQLLQSFTGMEATMKTELDVSKLSKGLHSLGLRALNDVHWSSTYYRTFLVPVEAEAISRLEYGWDKAPTPGKGTALSFTAGSIIDVTQSLSTASLSPGLHTLYLRAMTKHYETQTYVRTFFIPAATQQLARIEYGWDETPAVGKGTALEFKADTVVDLSQNLSVTALKPGLHTLYLRALSTNNVSQTYARRFFIPEKSQRLTRIEYGWDETPGIGRGTALSFEADTVVDLSESLSVAAMKPGLHTLYLRALSTNNVSQTYARRFFIPEKSQQLTRIEYGWDKVPNVGKGTAISFKADTVVDLSQSLSVGTMQPGLHTLYLRALSTNYVTDTYARSFYIAPASHKVQALEYWFDEDPGVGKATRMAATLTGDSLNMAFDLDTDGMTEGLHQIGLRTLTDGTWSETKVRRFLVKEYKDSHITRLEYFWNDDPGAGKGYVVDITPGEEVSIDFEADMTELGEGPHMLGLRAQSGSGSWSPVRLIQNIEFEGWDNLQEYLDSFEDTHDQLASGKYTRQYKNQDWQALYVPFTLNYSDWADHFDVARINAFYQYDDDEDGVVDRQVLEAIIVKANNGSLKANHPYLIRAKQKGAYTLNVGTARMVDKKVNSVSCSTMEARYTFTGNYTDLKGLKSAQRYRLRGGSLSIPESDDEVLPPYRWYLTIDNLGNQLQPSASRSLEVNIVGEEDTQGIYDMHFTRLQSDDNVEIADGECYDLMGRKVEGGHMKKGIYIFNNRKHVVK